MRDYLASIFTDSFAVSTQEFLPCALFLDGEFWGRYYLTTRFDEEFFENRYGVYGDNVVFVKMPDSEIESGDGYDLYREMSEYISKTDMSIDDNYVKACELIDVDSCVDYYACEIYLHNIDWPKNNLGLWRTKKNDGSLYSDGKWRWVIYDMNITMYNADMDILPRILDEDGIFASLMCNDGFRRKLEQRLVYLAENTFDPDKTDEFIDDFEARYADITLLEYKRFSGRKLDLNTFYHECEGVREFFHIRHDRILDKYVYDQQ